MEINNEFTVEAPIERVWIVLTDLATVASCLPGAALTGVDNARYLGTIKVKIGPVTTEYAGSAQVVEQDENSFQATIDARGTESRGAGRVSALIRASLREDLARTVVLIRTDMTITGKVAQFGKGMIEEISTKLIGQFVRNLEVVLSNGKSREREVDADTTHPNTDGDQVSESKPENAAPVPLASEALDLMMIAGGSIYKRLIPLAAALVIVVALIIFVLRTQS
jgi:carbon monoxide dehydrogenase subunit G